MGAPIGNQNASRGRKWRQAIERALAKRSKGDQILALDELAETLLKRCEEGDISALRELGDRIEGKAIQHTELSGPDGGEIPFKGFVVEYGRPSGTENGPTDPQA